MTTPREIESEIAALPPNLRAAVLDFVQFVKQRHGLPTAPATVVAATDTGDSAFFQALEAAGFVGCIETDEQLATAYKNRLDFSTKCGTRHDSGGYGRMAGLGRTRLSCLSLGKPVPLPKSVA